MSMASLGKYLPGQTVFVAARWAWVRTPLGAMLYALAEVSDQGLGRGDLSRPTGACWSKSPTRQMPIPYSSAS